MQFSKPVTQSKIRLLLADDHTILRQGMAQFLGQEPDIEIVGQAPDGEMAVNMATRLQPDVVVMDVGMPRMNGLEATRKIHNDLPQIRVIGLSMYEERERADAMLAAGASMYLTKTGPAQDLIEAIRSCARPGMILATGKRRQP